MKNQLLSIAFVTMTFMWMAQGHPAHDNEAAASIEPVAFGLPESRVSITEKGGKRIIESNDIPDHEPGQFPHPGNPNTIRPQQYHYEMPLHPVAAATTTELRRMDFGVAVNGVKFDPGTNEFWNDDRSSIWREEAIVQGKPRLGLDWSNAHVQPTGAYHYHGVPHGLIKRLHGEGKMVLVGWAADGFPVYGPWAHADPKSATSPVVKMKSSYQLKSGTRPDGAAGPGGRYDGLYTPDYTYVPGSGTLDECNGRAGVTPEFPQGTYYYVVTEDFPFYPRQFRGIPDESFRHRGPPGGPGGFGPPGGRRGGPPPPRAAP